MKLLRRRQKQGPVRFGGHGMDTEDENSSAGDQVSDPAMHGAAEPADPFSQEALPSSVRGAGSHQGLPPRAPSSASKMPPSQDVFRPAAAAGRPTSSSAEDAAELHAVADWVNAVDSLLGQAGLRETTGSPVPRSSPARSSARSLEAAASAEAGASTPVAPVRPIQLPGPSSPLRHAIVGGSIQGTPVSSLASRTPPSSSREAGSNTRSARKTPRALGRRAASRTELAWTRQAGANELSISP